MKVYSECFVFCGVFRKNIPEIPAKCEIRKVYSRPYILLHNATVFREVSTLPYIVSLVLVHTVFFHAILYIFTPYLASFTSKLRLCLNNFEKLLKILFENFEKVS